MIISFRAGHLRRKVHLIGGRSEAGFPLFAEPAPFCEHIGQADGTLRAGGAVSIGRAASLPQHR